VTRTPAGAASGAATASDLDAPDLTSEAAGDTALAGVRPLRDRTLAVVLVVLGAVALLASAELAIERYLTLVDPTHALSCTLNPLVDCGPAMDSWQGRVLGFPNPYIGLVAFPVVITSGVLWLTGYRPPRWYRLALLGGTVLGQALIFFLMFTILHELRSICLYCAVVWTCMWPLLWFQVVHALQTRALPAPDGLRRFAVSNRGLVLGLGYVVAVLWVALAMGRMLVASFLG
jgi:uncharacterized membrane protein